MDGIMDSLKVKIKNKDIVEKLRDITKISKRIIKANEQAALIDIDRQKILKELTDMMDKEYGATEWVDLDFLNAKVLLKEDYNKQAFRMINSREVIKDEIYSLENKDRVIENENQ